MSELKIFRDPVTHDIKIYPEFFSAVCTGVKRAELRKNDRDYRVGDTLHLMETERGCCSPTGEFINAIITHIADVSEWMPGYVLLSIEREKRERAEPVAYIIAGHYLMHANDPKVDNYSSAVPLYTAPPAPFVPDEMPEPDTTRMFFTDAVAEIAKAQGWNACRAAMLASKEAK